MRALSLALTLLVLVAGPAAAGEVILRDNVVDNDGQVTLGDLFDGAGQAGGLVIAQRQAPSVVLDAGAVQMAAGRAGLSWSNPRGLRRIIVRAGDAGPRPLNRSTALADGEILIRAGDLVSVRWADGGLSLTLDAKALTAAAQGQPLTLVNPTSKKTFEAIAVGPGRALAGPAGQDARIEASRLAALSSPQQR